MVAVIQIRGADLPGRSCGPSKDRPDGYHDVHVGLQRGREVVDLVPGDAPVAEWTFEVAVRLDRLGGPYVHGSGGDRFLYLSWGEVEGVEFRMFRRAKLRLEELDAASLDGRLVTGVLGLTDAKGHPVCASVRSPAITWTVTDR